MGFCVLYTTASSECRDGATSAQEHFSHTEPGISFIINLLQGYVILLYTVSRVATVQCSYFVCWTHEMWSLHVNRVSRVRTLNMSVPPLLEWSWTLVYKLKPFLMLQKQIYGNSTTFRSMCKIVIQYYRVVELCSIRRQSDWFNLVNKVKMNASNLRTDLH
jgi:hypothetical protein